MTCGKYWPIFCFPFDMVLFDYLSDVIGNFVGNIVRLSLLDCFN